MQNHIYSIQSENAPKAVGPYSQAVAAGPFLFLAGQIPIDPKEGKITASTIEEQTHQVLVNIKAVLAAENLNLQHVVKADVYLKDLQDFEAMNRVYSEHFNHPVKPARLTVQVAKLPMDCKIEIACIAYIIR